MRSTIGALMLAAMLSTAAHACPNCKEAVGAQPNGEGQRLASGYAKSIYLMMGMPMLLLATGAYVVTRAARRGTLPEL